MIFAHLKAASFALGVVLAGSLEWQPYILVAPFADGHVAWVPATDRTSCALAIAAIRQGWWQPDGAHGAVALDRLHCVRGDGFDPAELCIANYNCPRRGQAGASLPDVDAPKAGRGADQARNRAAGKAR